MTGNMTKQKISPISAYRSPYGSNHNSASDHQHTDTENSADVISAIENPLCSLAEKHRMGEYCGKCRTIMMPWFGKLPQPLDENSEHYVKAPRGSIVRGVPLQDPEAVAVMTLVASIDIIDGIYDDYEGLVEIMVYYSKAVTAGLLVAELYRIIARMSTPKHDMPTIADIVEAALQDPALTPEQYIRNTKVELGHYHHLRPVYGKAKFLSASGFSDVDPSPSPGFSSSWNEQNEFDDFTRPNLHGNSTHARPTDRGPWEFVPGSILSRVRLGVPEPHKFFMVRQAIHDPTKKDVRQFSSWQTMDWNEPADIAKLNKWQMQVKDRMQDRFATLPKQWSQAEKDVLKRAVEAALASGKDRSTINWDCIAKTLFNHFKGRTEYAGEPLAQSTELLPDNTVTAPSKKKIQLLKADRVGAVKRSGKAVSNQAKRFGDIALLLRMSRPYKARGVREDDENEAVDDLNDDDNTGQKGKKAAPKKGKKRRRDESPEAGSMSPAKISPTNAELFRAQVDKNINPWYKSKMKSQAPLDKNFGGDLMSWE
ncbi:hypothetical protein WAI453_012747 [Rhynchosporium graminicola]|uniref:Uncharacterized protein n=1 Tax=Rhynchosporium graminicola TaxID=2792576 RepID=A0A1E1KQA3_9HELO|nr:uncharacterized protein RCO7_08387 [Rhynchosporium commune]